MFRVSHPKMEMCIVKQVLQYSLMVYDQSLPYNVKIQETDFL
jgi:hypothetical protein